MAKIYRTALGRTIDMDSLRLSNEETIAVGNMKVNARGDELGPGGEVIRTRNQVMNDYYKLNTPLVETSTPVVADEAGMLAGIQAHEAAQPQPPIRGTLADQIAARRRTNPSE